jgi:hypothetical protein
VLLSLSSLGDVSGPSTVDVYVERSVELDARGVRVERRFVCVCDGGAVVLLPLAWADGERLRSRLPFLKSGNRERVKRREWIFGRAATAGVKTGVGVEGSEAAEAKWSVCSCSCFAMLLGVASTKTANREEAEEVDTVRGTNGVVKGIAVKGQDDHGEQSATSRRAESGYFARIGRPSATLSLGSGSTESSAA